MAYIYHEKQDAGLCGVHCLNNLLQGAYFNEIDLMKIAHDMDAVERSLMAEQGTDTKEFLKYMAEDSGNVADDGNYSIQVLGQALEGLGLVCKPISHESMADVRANPLKENAYICNLSAHWIAVRKLNGVWWNLNSTEKKPKVLSEIYLGAYMHQLQKDGYSIFVVRGTFPATNRDADNPNWIKTPELPKPQPFSGTGHKLGGGGSQLSNSGDDDDLKQAIRASLQDTSSGKPSHNAVNLVDSDEDSMDTDLAQAIALSKQTAAQEKKLSVEELKASLPAEPTEAATSTTIDVRLTDGTRTRRKFPRSSKLGVVYTWLQTQGIDVTRHKLVTTLPKKDYDAFDSTLEELKLIPLAALTLVHK